LPIVLRSVQTWWRIDICRLHGKGADSLVLASRIYARLILLVISEVVGYGSIPRAVKSTFLV